MARKIKLKYKEISGDVLLKPKSDRRILSNVPPVDTSARSNADRRSVLKKCEGEPIHYKREEYQTGVRYHFTQIVQLFCYKKGKRTEKFILESTDISGTGMQLHSKGAQILPEGTQIMLNGFTPEQISQIQNADKYRLKFKIPPGSMPEGYESNVNVPAELVRLQEDGQSGIHRFGFRFTPSLSEYINRRQGRSMFLLSALMLVFVSLFIILMRAESILYFRFNKGLYLYSILTAIFLLSRYFFGMLYRPVPINMDYTPGVTLIIPCFDEEEWIDRTIISCMNQDYPADKLEVIIIDDCSNDRSVEVIRETIDLINRDNGLYKTKDRLSYYVQPKNAGKRDALAEGIYRSQHDLIIVVDSDSFLDPFAVRNLVQPFQDPKVGGVAGRTDVANVYTNWLTKMQATRYYIAFRIMKAAESYFDAVTCLSGPLSCYRKDIVMENIDAWLNQKFLGQRATFGDDRSLTNFVLKKYRTVYQDTAICSTIVPNKQKIFLKQQMRWKRSWLRESVIAASYIWKKEPFASLFFYMGLAVPFAAPVIVLYNLMWVPITENIFPTTFLMGIIMMALLMSICYLLFKRSSVWIYGVFFCIYYEAVLLWQMPVAWVTFWKSTWGTRMTPEDIQEAERKRGHANKKKVKAPAQ